MDVILGASGFVGFHIYQNIPNAIFINSSNIKSIHGGNFNNVYCCCLPAVKWYSNAYPDEDKLTIENIKTHIDKIESCKLFTLISTIDVHNHNFPVTQEEDENDIFNVSDDAYGRHRYEFEQWIKSRFNNAFIIRLPALFGIGLKKNVLYDLLNHNCLNRINLYDMYQWYDLRWLYSDIVYMHSHNIHKLNAYPESIKNIDIVCKFFPHLFPLLPVMNEDMRINNKKYNHKSKYQFVIRSKEQILHAMGIYISVSRVDTSLLAISSLHWTVENDEYALRILSKYGISNIELAPWQYLPYYESENIVLEEAKRLFLSLKNRGFNIVSLQAIFTGVNGTIVENKSAINSRLELVSKISEILKSKIIVFGAPILRSCGTVQDMIDILNTYNGNTLLCVENVSKQYGCSIGTTISELTSMINMCKNKNVALVLDLGNHYMEKHDINEEIQLQNIKHIHLSMPNLRDIDSLVINQYDKEIISKNSDMFITMEVKNTVLSLANNIYEFLKWVAVLQNIDTKVLVIGAGWYGCHIASLLIKNNFSIAMIDKNDTIGEGSSSHNQNRLHLGYHYPRSYKTRTECKQGYTNMIERYENILSHCKSFYIISKHSLIDFNTYCAIFKHDNYDLRFVDVSDIYPIKINTSMIDGKVIMVDEMYINHNKMKSHFNNLLSSHIIKMSDFQENIKYQYRYVIDCTYGQLIDDYECKKEHCISFVYKLLDPHILPFSITVMDGPFFSIHPYDTKNRLYTLTHVHHGVIKYLSDFDKDEILVHILEDVKKYIFNFDECFEYYGFFVAYKAKKLNDFSADRSIIYKQNHNLHSFVGGKITGIFEAENIVNDIIISQKTVKDH
jgi:hypothetical protein